MSVLGEFDLPGVVPGCFLGRPFCALLKQGLQAPGSELLGQKLGIPRTEKWPKTGHADDWVYCESEFVSGFRCSQFCQRDHYSLLFFLKNTGTFLDTSKQPSDGRPVLLLLSPISHRACV